MPARSICVFCSSSNQVDPAFFAAARALGDAIARRDWGLIFGGTNVGLMGEVAKAAHAGGGHIVGILPQAFASRNMAFDLADEIIVTSDIRERKAAMEARADAFIAMPGGFGTLEEVLEILTLRQLDFHTKPVVFLNADGFYNHLIQFFERLTAEHFTRPDTRALYHLAPTVADALDYIEHYEPLTTPGEWF